LIDLKALTDKGPVLVRLTCGCSGCDKELAYFQSLHKEYEGKGLTSLAIFREPDEKVQKYVEEKKLKMLYAVDTKGASWDVFQTKTMPTNFLIEKGGKIKSIAAGCDPSGCWLTKSRRRLPNSLRPTRSTFSKRLPRRTNCFSSNASTPGCNVWPGVFLFQVTTQPTARSFGRDSIRHIRTVC